MAKLNIGSVGKHAAKPAGYMALGMTTGVSTNEVNNKIQQRRIQKVTTYKRKLPNGKTVRVQKSPFHGLARGQHTRKKAVTPVVVVNSSGTGGGTGGLY